MLTNAQVKTKLVGLFPWIGGMGYHVEGDGYVLPQLPRPEKVERPVRTARDPAQARGTRRLRGR